MLPVEIFDELNKISDELQTFTSLQKNDQKSIIILYLIITISTSLITIFVNYLVQSKLNTKTNDIDKAKIKILRKLEHIENLYSSLQMIQINAITQNKQDQLSRIKKTRNWVSIHRILLTKELYRTTDSILDYYSNIINNPQSRKPKQEEKLFEKFIEEYDKV